MIFSQVVVYTEIIAIRFHSSEELNYGKQLGFDKEPQYIIENLTNRQVELDCVGNPQDDCFSEILYMRCKSRQVDSKAIFNFLLNCLHDDSNLLIEIFACNKFLNCEKLLYSNATSDLYYGYGWRWF